MAASLVESLAADFDPTQFEDAYQAAMRDLVERKLEGAPLAPAADEEAATGGEVVDLLTALQRSVERARAGRGEGAADAAPAAASAGPAADDEAPAKKTATKRTTTKKTARSA